MVDNRACPKCGSYNTSYGWCNDCNTMLEDSEKQETYIIDRKGVFDEQNQICKPKVPLLQKKAGDRRVISEIGSLELHKERSDKIELLDKNRNPIGILQMVEKDLFTLVVKDTIYKMNRIGSIPFNVFNSNGDSILRIIDNPSNYTKQRLGVAFPSYKLISVGILDQKVVAMLLVFYYYYYAFIYALKPLIGSSFTVKRKLFLGFRFYDSYGNLIAKTYYYNKIWWIIGYLTSCFIIGLFILAYLFFKVIGSGKIVTPEGREIGTYKMNFSKRIITCSIPSQQWNGIVTFNKNISIIQRNGKTGQLNASDEIYTIKSLTILKDKFDKNVCQIFGYGNNFVVMKDDQFDSDKAYLLSIIIIISSLLRKGG